MVFDIVGRDEEIGVLSASLRRTGAGLHVLVIEGAAGIGKSTLWRAGVSAAREEGMRVLTSTPAEAEQGLAYAGIGDLLEGVLDDVLPELPHPRRRALQAALLLEESPRDIDPRAVAVAMRNVLDRLAGDGPLVLAVDDVQWLDASSVAALAFALRRVEGRPVRLLLARRLGGGRSAVKVEQSVGLDRVTRLRLDTLSVGATQQLLRERLGRRFARATLLRIHDASGGNPFYSLEIARAVGEELDPTAPLPIPETLEELVSSRFDGLPAATREALLLVAALGTSSRSVLAHAGVTDEALECAAAAHLVARAGESIEFTHPLLASVLYHDAAPAERRRAHEILAESVDDPADRGRHLALSADVADEDVAAAVAEAAAVALARGAPLVAAELWEHALRLTPPEAAPERHRRAIAAARSHLASGEMRRARSIADDLFAAASPGHARAEALVLLSDIEETAGNEERPILHRRQALREPDVQPRLQAEIHQRLAELRPATEGLAVAEKHARTALDLAESIGDDALHAGTLAVLAGIRFNGGHSDATALAEQAHERALASGDAPQGRRAAFALAHILVWSHERERACALLEGLYEELSGSDEFASAEALWYLSLLDLRTGRFSSSARYARRAHEIYLQYALDGAEHGAGYWLLALSAAHLGELDEAREFAERFGGPATLGLVRFWQGELREAVPHFQAGLQTYPGNREPAMWWFCADYVEALLELGRVDDAIELLDEWESNARDVGRAWALAHVRRCRGLVAAAGGDIERADALLARAVDEHAAAEDPFGRGRALLALGLVRRRARQKRAAREAIEAAAEQFEELEAAGWAARARAEIGRIGGRTREEGLSAAERRVAELVAEGRTNREVAAALFLRESTVETHLRHVYAKLGVRSRTELARSLGSPS
jgi:DNA-binding CsgD family transcriptional regulator